MTAVVFRQGFHVHAAPAWLAQQWPQRLIKEAALQASSTSLKLRKQEPSTTDFVIRDDKAGNRYCIFPGTCNVKDAIIDANFKLAPLSGSAQFKVCSCLLKFMTFCSAFVSYTCGPMLLSPMAPLHVQGLQTITMI